MATTVQSFVGGGTNLTELTSGELLLCSFLKTGYIQVRTFGTNFAYVDFGYDDGGTSRKGLDTSKISQISFRTGNYSGRARITWKNDSTYTEDSFSTNNNPFSINAPSGDNSHSTLTITTADDNVYCVVKVTSFTTTDGKVHTADNLNY